MPLKLDGLSAVLSSSGDTATLTIAATSGTLNKIYFVYQMMSNSAIAADVQLTFVDLIQLVANINLSSVPFINSFDISSMAFTASIDSTQTPLFEHCLNLTHLYIDTPEELQKGSQHISMSSSVNV